LSNGIFGKTGATIELFLFAFNLKEVCGVLNFKKILKKKKKTHKMFSLMLDTQFKNLLLVSSFVNCEQNISIIEEHDKKSLHPIFF
jgi:hypothetical protein